MGFGMFIGIFALSFILGYVMHPLSKRLGKPYIQAEKIDDTIQ
jgi:hypothetical protein